MTQQTIRLTDSDIDKLRSPSGGFSARVYASLGKDPTDMRVHGWLKRLRGQIFSREIFDQAVAIAKMPRLKCVRGGEAKGQLALFS